MGNNYERFVDLLLRYKMAKDRHERYEGAVKVAQAKADEAKAEMDILFGEMDILSGMIDKEKEALGHVGE